MKLMITGAGGMTGSELARQAATLGWRTAAFSRKELDIGDHSAVNSAVGRMAPDAIVNAAAYTAVDGAESEPERAVRANAEGPRNLARAAEAGGAALVHISTDYVFDGTASNPYKPADPVHPLGVYGRSKHAGEVAVTEECPVHLIVRTSWVYSHEGRNFLTTMVRASAEGRDLRVVDDQRGSPTAAADLAGALLRATEYLKRRPSLAGTYHFSNAGVTTWYDFAKAIFDMRDAEPPHVIPIPTSEYPTAAKRPAYSVLDTSSFEEAFDVTPRPWRDALRDTLSRMT